MLQIADRDTQEAFNAQNEGVAKKTIRARFSMGPEPDDLRTYGCPKSCDEQHAHLESCVTDGCPPNCNQQHPHGEKCGADCRQAHHVYTCQNKHHVKAEGSKDFPKFKEVVYLTKIIPGDNTLKIHRPYRPGDELEFPREWEDFKSGTERPRGTSLDLIPFLDEGQKAEFRAANCHTAEDIANMADSVAQKFMGIHGIRRQVQNFLAATQGKVTKSDLDERDNKIKVLEEALQKLEAKLNGKK